MFAIVWMPTRAMTQATTVTPEQATLRMIAIL
jgi:hypothetical protein